MNRRKTYSALVVPICLTVFFWFGSMPTEALTLVPPSLEFSVQPGQTVDTKIKLFNEEADPISVFTSTSNFTAAGEDGEPNFDFAEDLVGLADWLDVGVGPFTLQPGDRLEIPVTINVPVTAEPGGHYASVFFGTDPSLRPEDDGGQVSIRSLIGTLVILRVEGAIREQASIAEFSTDGKPTSSRLPIDLVLRVNNQGNVHVRPKGTIVIKNLFGGESTRLTLNESNGAVLPDSTRRFDTRWMRDDATGQRGNFFQELGAEWRNFALGPYTATATVAYGQADLSLTSETKFTVWPWRVLLVSLLLVASIIFVLVFGVKRYNQAIISRAQKTPPPGAMK